MPINHWSVVEEMDPVYKENFQTWHRSLLANTALDRRQRELINLAMACILREREVIVAHAQEAQKYGATKAEILATVEQVMTMGGLPAFRAAMLALHPLFCE